jgi:YtkA-like
MRTKQAQRYIDLGRRPSMWFRAARGCLGAALAVTLAACGGAPPPTPEVPASFPAAPLLAVDSTAGQLHVELRASPDPFVRGQNVGEVTVTNESGQPVDGLTLTVVPWMPAHGHGTSVQPAITDTGDGVFVANPLYLFMAGQWELRMTFTGVVNDSATATVAIP